MATKPKRQTPVRLFGKTCGSASDLSYAPLLLACLHRCRCQHVAHQILSFGAMLNPCGLTLLRIAVDGHTVIQQSAGRLCGSSSVRVLDEGLCAPGCITPSHPLSIVMWLAASLPSCRFCDGLWRIPQIHTTELPSTCQQ